MSEAHALGDSSSRQRTFAIVGGTLWGNRGAEAMVVTTIGRIRERYPDASFLLMSYYPARDRRLAEGTRLLVDDARPIILATCYVPFALACWLARRIGVRLPDGVLPGCIVRLRSCSALFDVSGISFHDGRGIGIVAYNVCRIWPALLLGVPVFRLSQAMGPFRNRLNRLLAKRFLSACRHTFARGRITSEYLTSLDLPPDKWSMAADVAFSFVPGDSITRENQHECEILHRQLMQLKRMGARIVAVSPSTVVLRRTGSAGVPYIDILTKAAAHLQNLGCYLLVVPNATRAGELVDSNNDFFVIAELKQAIEREGSGVDPSRVLWVQFDLNTDSLRELIGECHLLLTSRFHAMVAGLALGIPTFVVGWSHKYQEVLELFGCEANAIDFSAMDGRLLSELDRMLAQAGDIREQIATRLPEVTASSRRQFEVVDELIG